MNPVFWLLIIIIAIIIWFFLSIIFKPLGKLIYRIMNGIREILKEENEVENK